MRRGPLRRSRPARAGRRERFAPSRPPGCSGGRPREQGAARPPASPRSGRARGGGLDAVAHRPANPPNPWTEAEGGTIREAAPPSDTGHLALPPPRPPMPVTSKTAGEHRRSNPAAPGSGRSLVVVWSTPFDRPGAADEHGRLRMGATATAWPCAADMPEAAAAPPAGEGGILSKFGSGRTPTADGGSAPGCRRICAAVVAVNGEGWSGLSPLGLGPMARRT